MAGYVRAHSVDEALELLSRGPLRIVAGGTDVYPALVDRPLREPVLDVSGVAGLRGVTRHDGGFRFGALTTWTDVIRADLPARFDGLKLAAREVGGVQIQNAGTVAGNICNASPAADGTPLPAREVSDYVRFRLRARDVPGPANLTFTASFGERARGQRRIDLSVRPATPFMTRLSAGVLPRGDREIRIERQMYPHHRTLEAGASMLPSAATVSKQPSSAAAAATRLPAEAI